MARVDARPPSPDEGALVSSSGAGLSPTTRAFYRAALAELREAGIQVLVGGAIALEHYSGVSRGLKDLDVFLRPDDFPRALDALAWAGYRTEIPFPHWLGKAYAGDDFIDLIFSSGNGIATVDDAWFEHAVEDEVLGMPVGICPAEETIWSKAFIMERERYDGADVNHILHARAEQLDWVRLLGRFGRHWRVLLSHLLLFGFVYPGERDRIPASVMQALMRRLEREQATPPPADRICQGTLISREQYLPDVEQRGYTDARLVPRGSMTEEDAALWTAAIEKKG